ncbi:uncharacterized protein LOC143899465 isoform X3 [Temnothorax americanus]|uniref:uncharacterized protein LOC143899465 isoform X3 n=1 Tax=Temnothorax americanus TaxID=1964332 RepID=UPI0040689EB1
MHDFTQMQNIQNLTEITDFSQCNIVVFDLETAGFAKSDEILQIAAYVENETFSVYISPTQLISKTATAVTGLHAMSGELYLHGTKMISTSATDAVNQFISFLRKYDQCLLIAHNCFKFDAPRLIKLIEKQTYEKNGVDGLRILLSQSIDGKPRITNNKRVIDKICDIFTLQESCEK